MEVQSWYIEVGVNNPNFRAYSDMMKDMEKLGNGVFTCTVKLNEGMICDYLNIDNEAYVNSRTSKAV